MKTNKTNKKILIFDFMRTLYEPNTEMLTTGAFEILQILHENHYDLHLISRDEGQRMDIIEQFGIKDFFQEIHLVPEKNRETFSHIAKRYEPKNVFVVGDRIYDEIEIGNSLGYKTIWYKKGKFAHLVPQNAKQVPWRTITHLFEIKKLLVP